MVHAHDRKITVIGTYKTPLVIISRNTHPVLHVVGCHPGQDGNPTIPLFLGFGAVDYCRDMHVKITNEAVEQLWGRAKVAIACRAAGLVAIDAPFVSFKDTEAFEQNVRDGLQMGYGGRMIIHPSQIPVAHRLYSPTDEAVAHARKVKKFFEEEGLAKGLASVSMDGGMVDTPVYVSACETIERYEAIQAKEAKRK